ncbi:MAG: metallophosphoesterase [Candidatus Glassbacteria bacterium]
MLKGKFLKLFPAVLFLTAAPLMSPAGSFAGSSADSGFTFVVTCDMREFATPKYDSPQYFRGVVEAVARAGKGDFMISPGDIDPPRDVKLQIEEALGKDYLWYPTPGNHETETPEDMQWLREYNANGKSLPHIVRPGPEKGRETTYSFEYGNAHFAMLDQYYDGSSDTGSNGDVSDALYRWLEADLAANTRPIVFVVGHEPIMPMPDLDSGRIRHTDDSLNEHPENDLRFVRLLRRHKAYYICGHTHSASVACINGVWQIDAGHSRGIGDKGAPSTFLRVHVTQGPPQVEIWRDDGSGTNYTLTSTWTLREVGSVKEGQGAATGGAGGQAGLN